MNFSSVALTRFIVGFLQGVLLYFLYLSMSYNTWPATNGLIFKPLLVIFIFVPFIVIQGLGHFQKRIFPLWPLGLTLLLTILAYHHAWSQTYPFDEAYRQFFSWKFFLLVGFGLFIAQSLILSSSQDQRFFANYTTYFDVAWKFAVQLVLVLIFVGLFWALLNLGAELFSAIGLTFLKTLIAKNWFYFPATTLMVTAALHITDVQTSMVRGIRSIVLTLLSWLLPLMTLLASGFLFSLLFVGTTQFFQTRYAASILLASTIWLIILINAVYQDGKREDKLPKVLNFSGKIASAILLPLVLLACYALYLRVAQYGWTESRISAAMSLIILSCYAIGYGIAVLRPGPWLQTIEKWNVATSFLILLMLVLMLSPIADPDRLAVANQVSRLKTGAVAAEKFDYDYLRIGSHRYGADALAELKNFKEGPKASLIREYANKVLSMNALSQPSQISLAARITVYPTGKTLPASFLAQDFLKPQSGILPTCLTQKTHCDAWLVDINHDGKEEIILLDDIKFTAFQENDKQWKAVGTWFAPYNCYRLVESARKEGLKFVAPVVLLPDLEVAGVRLRFMQQQTYPDCP